MSKQDSQKRNYGGATQRSQPSFAAQHLEAAGLVQGHALDFGCGFGFDAKHYGWDSFDPFYGPLTLRGPYDTVLCTQVLNAISRKHRAWAISTILDLLAEHGAAYICVARNLPVGGKVCALKRRQYYVVLRGDGVSSVHRDNKREIYKLVKSSSVIDETID